jgi:predicted nucleotidyltransferase
MPDESTLDPRNPLKSIVRLFGEHGVEYIIIGGQAGALMGANRVTFDVDVCYARGDDNVARLAAALARVRPTLRGAPPDLPFTADARTIRAGLNFTLDTVLGPFDLLGFVEPIGGYEVLLPGSELYEVQGLRVRTIGLEDLIRIKRHLKREKDLEALRELEEIRMLRRRGLA